MYGNIKDYFKVENIKLENTNNILDSNIKKKITLLR